MEIVCMRGPGEPPGSMMTNARISIPPDARDQAVAIRRNTPKSKAREINTDLCHQLKHRFAHYC